MDYQELKEFMLKITPAKASDIKPTVTRKFPGTVWLYSYTRGEIFKNEGYITYKYYSEKSKAPYEALFTTLDGRVYTCYVKPGIIKYQKFWFIERDDLAAIDIFLESEKNTIYLIETELLGHKEKLKYIESARKAAIE